MQKFGWDPLINPVGKTEFRVLTARFGDGYAQRAGDGINARVQTWPLEFAGDEREINPIRQFLDIHAGYKAFLWSPPLGAETSYVAPDGYTMQAHGAGFFTLAVTFVEAPRP